MRYEIELAPEAVKNLKRLRPHDRAAAKEAIEMHLRHEPTKTSKSRIKRLRGISKPQYRLRVDDVRVFYDVSGHTVEVLCVVSKAGADAWLSEMGEQR